MERSDKYRTIRLLLSILIIGTLTRRFSGRDYPTHWSSPRVVRGLAEGNGWRLTATDPRLAKVLGAGVTTTSPVSTRSGSSLPHSLTPPTKGRAGEADPSGLESKVGRLGHVPSGMTSGPPPPPGRDLDRDRKIQ